MRRAPPLLIAALIAAWGAHAENAPLTDAIPSTTPSATLAQATPSATPAGATAPAATAKVELKPGDKKKDDEDKPNKFPLHADLTLDNSVGEGVFGTYGNGVDVPINEGSSSLHFGSPPLETVWGTSIRLGGSASIPKTDYSPKLGLSTGVGFAVGNWLGAYGNSTVYEREIILSDLSVGLSAPAVWTEEFTGIKLSPGIGVRLPLSLHSRQTGLVSAFSGRIGASWSTEETPVGTFSVNYTPSLGFNWFANPFTPNPGVGSTTVGTGVAADPLTSLGSIPTVYCRSTEALSATGECALAGRQGLVSLSNSVGGSWSFLDHHSVSVSLGYSVGFLRSLRNDPSLSGAHATNQSFNDNTFGSLSYAYDVPVDFAHVSLAAGVGSGQSAFDREGNFNFPFWNFWYPNSNTSSAFFDVSVGI